MKWIEYHQSWIVRIIELLEADNLPMMIAMYPHLPLLENPNKQTYFSSYENLAQRHRVYFHNATADFMSAGNPSDLFLAGNMHFNYSGQNVWAESLSSFIAEHLDDLFGRTSHE